MIAVGWRVAAAVGAVVLAAGCGSESTAQPGAAAPGKKVVAASAWEATFAKAAGAKDITVIVPASVAHAADYDPKPSDLAAVAWPATQRCRECAAPSDVRTDNPATPGPPPG